MMMSSADDPSHLANKGPNLSGMPHPGDDASPGKPLSVLIVEDDSVISGLLAEMLEAMGHQVCSIEATEADAVAGAEHFRPQLMIVDVRLGDGSGVAAVDAIHRTVAIPHIFVSGDIARVQALRPYAVILQKPYSELDLARAIRRALDAATAPEGGKSPL